MIVMKNRIKILVVAMLTFTLMLATTVSAGELEDARNSASYGSFGVLKDRLDYADQRVVDLSRNVKDYGAVGNGSTDDTAAIQAAIDSLNNARGIVFFPAGFYYCAGSIDAKRAAIRGITPPGRSGGGGTRISFTSGTGGIYSSIPDNFGYEISDLEVWGSNGGVPTATGQILIDFSGQNYPRLSNLRLWQGDVGIRLKTDYGVGCYYGVFNRIDINQCYVGVEINPAANSHTFIAGRVWKCKTGMKISSANNINLYGVYFERSVDYAIDSSGHNVNINGCRLENPDVIASIYVRSGAGPHFLFGNHFSSGVDIKDDTLPSVIYGIDRPDVPLAASFMTRNLLANGSFEHDLDSDGLADGWSVTWFDGGTHVETLDPTEAQDSDYAQKVSNTSVNHLRIYQIVKVTPNTNYTLRFRAKASAGSNFLRIGDGSSASDYSLKYVTLTTDSSWHTYTYTIASTTSNINICFYFEGTTARNVWIDDVVLNPGIFTTSGFLPKTLTEEGGVVSGSVKLEGAVGFNGAAPVTQGPPIADADGSLSDATAKFNTLLNYLQSRGDIARGDCYIFLDKFCSAWLSGVGEPSYESRFDYDNSDFIDLKDFATFAETCN